MIERLHKYMARCGVASRRRCEELIAEGKVMVNGKVVTTPGSKIDSAHDEVKVEGRPLQIVQRHTYILLNKPPGYITSASDEYKRQTVFDLIENHKGRLFSVGRLDLDTRGLLVLTDDGELTYRLTHPKHKIEKEYIVRIDGIPTSEEIDRLQKGVPVEEGYTTQPCSIKLASDKDGKAMLRIIIAEGRKRQVKRMLKFFDYNVLYLKRIRLGNLYLADLPEGAWRYLTKEEVKGLKQLAGLDLSTSS